YVNAAQWVAWALRDTYGSLSAADQDDGAADDEPADVAPAPPAADTAPATSGAREATSPDPDDVSRLLQAIDIALHMVRTQHREHEQAALVAFDLALAMDAPDDVTYPLQAASSDNAFGDLGGYEIMLLTARRHLGE